MADDGRSLIDRALSVLDTFGGGRTRQTLSEISRHSGLPISTCYRIATKLTAWGALERDAENRYRVGLRLWELASSAPRAVGLQRTARPFMQDLYETTGFATHLAIRDGHELVSLQRFQSPHAVVRRPLTGSRYPLHATAIGQVLLAFAPPAVREAVLAEPLPAFTSRTITDPIELAAVLARVVQHGYAVTDRQVDEVHTATAAPIFGPTGTVIAAVSLAVPSADHQDAVNVVHLIRLTASSISRALGAPTPR